MDILKAINSSSGYVSVLQMQALGPADTLPSEIALFFCSREEGKACHGWGCAQALTSLLPMSSSLSSAGCCNYFGGHSYVHKSRLPSCLLSSAVGMCPSIPVVPGEWPWWHHTAAEGMWVQKTHSCAVHLPSEWPDPPPAPMEVNKIYTLDFNSSYRAGLKPGREREIPD